MNDINLLPHKRGARSKKPLKIVRITAVVSLFLVLSISILFFVLKLFSPLGSLEKEESQLLLELNAMKTKYENLLVLKDRLDKIGKVLETRADLVSKLTTITGIIPTSVSVQSLAIDPKSISVTVSSNDLNGLDSFLIGLVDLSQNKRMFKTLTLNELDFDQLKGYELTVKGNVQ